MRYVQRELPLHLAAAHQDWQASPQHSGDHGQRLSFHHELNGDAHCCTSIEPPRPRYNLRLVVITEPTDTTPIRIIWPVSVVRRLAFVGLVSTASW
jgi:hypothetical protein